MRELILYVSQRCEGDPNFSKTKLFKILFYSDFEIFAEQQKAITGYKYCKLPYGPVPDRGFELLDTMAADGELAIGRRMRMGLEQQRPMAMREPDLSLFSGAEIARVDAVIEELRPMSATGVSDLSHTFIGWKAARWNEEIPYGTSMLDTSPPTEEELAWVGSLAEAGL